MEKFKVKMVRTFVQQSEKHIEEFYSTVVDLAEEVRKCYDEDGSVELDDMMEFTKMMFLDEPTPFSSPQPIDEFRFGDEVGMKLIKDFIKHIRGGDGRNEEQEEGMMSKAITNEEGGNKASKGGEGMCELAQGTQEVVVIR
ncbi:hypothetical protein DKX38_023666 [Salix brachista]|uniref:Uncharacterized protein n=1 Tax=Salix brachista TaxID=2182728 RepID=A0A5N5JX85_9ROSI|nr:hypothetical protein DKX38_023666 [Salix brachista]